MSGTRVMVLAATLSLGVVQTPSVVVLGSDMQDGYRGEAPPFAVDGAPWLGLFAEAEGPALQPVELQWMEVEVPPGVEGGRYRLSSDPERPLFVVTGVGGLSAGEVRAARPSAVELSEREARAVVELGGEQYALSLESSYPDQCRAVVTVSAGARSQAIPVEALLGCGDPHFTIHWAGDLDADGALDLLATFSMKYSYHPRQLFLSSAAEPGSLMGLAAATDRTAS